MTARDLHIAMTETPENILADAMKLLTEERKRLEDDIERFQDGLNTRNQSLAELDKKIFEYSYAIKAIHKKEGK